MSIDKLIDEALNEGGVEDIVRYGTLKNVKVKVPSFTFTADMRVDDSEEWDSRMVKQPIGIEIDSFRSNIEDVLDEVVSKAIAEAVGKLIKDLNIDTRGSYIGGHMTAFPNILRFNKK